jgi:HD-GYP domain-containing protein (c-di-GMP phosphodiesterase class II)
MVNRLLPTTVPAGAADQNDAWDHLDRFLKQLQLHQDVGGQLRAMLDMVRTTTHSDAVLLCSGPERAISEWSGPARPDLAAWSRLIFQVLGQEEPVEGHLLAPSLEGLPGKHSAGSIALLRLSRSRNAWIAALRFSRERPLSNGDLKVMSLARRLLHQQQQQQMTYDELKEMLFSLVRCLTASLDARDPYTWGHSERVARIAVRLSEQMQLPEGQRSDLYLGGLLHDVGKIGVPDQALRKPGTLTAEEFAQVQQHVVIGDAIVGHVRQLAHLRPIVRNHHERYDGKGYPDQLAGEQIPLLARIVAVADGFDAMMSDRPYRKAMPAAQVESILAKGAGSQWDPQVIEAFFACKDEVFPIAQRGLGDSAVRAVEQALINPEHGDAAVRSFLAQQPAIIGSVSSYSLRVAP